METKANHQFKMKNRFAKLWAASGASNLADGVGLTAAPLLAATLTRDPLLVSGLVIAQRLPWFLFVLVSGALVDRLDRRKVMKFSNLSRFLLLAALSIFVLLERANLPLMYLVFFLLGTIETLFDNAAIAILPVIVPEEKLEQANGRLFATSSLTNELVGPSLGSFLFSILRSAPFGFASLTYGIASLMLGLLPGRYRPTISSDRLNLFQEISHGLKWFWQHRLLRTLGFFAAACNFVFAAVMGVFVLFAQDVLGLSDAAYGLVISMGAVGGIVGSLLTKKLSDRFGSGTILLADGLIMGLSYVGIALSTNPLVVGMMFILISMASMFGNVVIISLRQSIIPDHLLGRVASAYRLLALGALPLGALFGGLIARTINLAAPILAGGILLIVVTFLLRPIVNNHSIAQAKGMPPAKVDE